MLDRLKSVLKARFGSAPALVGGAQGVEVLAEMANRRVVRRYSDKPLDPALLDTLCAVALSAPSKSDLQQADIVIVTDKAQREKLQALIPENPGPPPARRCWCSAATTAATGCCSNGAAGPS